MITYKYQRNDHAAGLNLHRIPRLFRYLALSSSGRRHLSPSSKSHQHPIRRRGIRSRTAETYCRVCGLAARILSGHIVPFARHPCAILHQPRHRASRSGVWAGLHRVSRLCFGTVYTRQHEKVGRSRGVALVIAVQFSTTEATSSD